MSNETKPEYSPGLAGVIAGETASEESGSTANVQNALTGTDCEAFAQ